MRVTTVTIRCDYCGLPIRPRAEDVEDDVPFDRPLSVSDDRGRRWFVQLVVTRAGPDDAPDLHPACKLAILNHVSASNLWGRDQSAAAATVKRVAKKMAKGLNRPIRLRD